MKLRRTRDGASSPDEVVEFDVRELDGTFAAPTWLRDLGYLSWLLVGVVLVLVGLVWLVGATYVITIPVILGGVLSAVAAPAIGWLQGRGVGRALAAVILLLAFIAFAILILLMVLKGILGESQTISNAMNKALDELQGALKSAGITQDDVKKELQQAIPKIGGDLVDGAGGLISGLTSVASLFIFTAFSTFFLLKDGPTMRRWVESHSGLPESVARMITGDTIHALRAYFLGVTIVALFNATLIGGTAVLLGIPLAGTITVVTFVGAYIPFIGAWIAGIFAVAMALSTGNETDAIVMAVVALLANGILQQIVQPIAYGATLKLNPLVVLIVTIGGGALFGMVGLLLSAPLTSAAVNIIGELTRRRDEEQAADARVQASASSPPDEPPAADPAPA